MYMVRIKKIYSSTRVWMVMLTVLRLFCSCLLDLRSGNGEMQGSPDSCSKKYQACPLVEDRYKKMLFESYLPSPFMCMMYA